MKAVEKGLWNIKAARGKKGFLKYKGSITFCEWNYRVPYSVREKLLSALLPAKESVNCVLCKENSEVQSCVDKNVKTDSKSVKENMFLVDGNMKAALKYV